MKDLPSSVRHAAVAGALPVPLSDADDRFATLQGRTTLLQCCNSPSLWQSYPEEVDISAVHSNAHIDDSS